MSAHLSITVPRNDRAPALTRDALESVNQELGLRVADVRLLVSELVTNSVKYGGDGPIRLDVSVGNGRARAEIIDQGAGFRPEARDHDLDRIGGWGLHLVDNLADRWGTFEGSTHVWFEMLLPR